MTEHEFYHSTMRYLICRLEAYQKDWEELHKLIEYHAWLSGNFVRSAVFAKKYPPCPIKDELQEVVDKMADGDNDEEMKRKAGEMVFARLEEMARRHERAVAKGAKKI